MWKTKLLKYFSPDRPSSPGNSPVKFLAYSLPLVLKRLILFIPLPRDKNRAGVEL
jgi:hypothetical protein